MTQEDQPLGAMPFRDRHIGPSREEAQAMCRVLGLEDLDALVRETIPASLLTAKSLDLPEARSEDEVLRELRDLAARNEPYRSFLGMGFYRSVTPAVIRRLILENPAWYTPYTPYQPEISQGRLEALFNFQTMVSELTGLPAANASLLDEASAAAEAVTLAHRVHPEGGKRQRVLCDRNGHPQNLAVLATRTEALGFELEVADLAGAQIGDDVFAVVLHYPCSDGLLENPRPVVEKAHEAGALVVCVTDPLALTLIQPPGSFGADIAVGTTQRFGIPLWNGGPNAAFLAAREDFLRKMPGRIVGLTRDDKGRPAFRLALQTREQHIRRDRATSNICTAQVLLAVAASMYAVWHGPEGLAAIARGVHARTRALAEVLEKEGHRVLHPRYFDTLRVRPRDGDEPVLERARDRRINLRRFDDGTLGLSLDEATTDQDLVDLAWCFGSAARPDPAAAEPVFGDLARTTPFLTAEVFRVHRSEQEFVRYVRRLESRDLSLVHSMISLGSCTMKLNAAAEMLPILEPGFTDVHPFAPPEQSPGYGELMERLSSWLCEITGFDACSLQPNAGSQGEYAGLLVIRARHRDRGEAERDVCLIPASAHGTNPASAVLAGMRVVVVPCDARGNIDLEALEELCRRHSDRLAAIMVTYPSTHGVFEEGIRRLCDVVHEHGGLVYLDGANLNAMVGLVRPAELGADVCHLNLHKTFCIPHGGGGPGAGPICVTAELAPYLPGHPIVPCGGEKAIGPICATPFGSPGILPISYAYIALMGPDGLTDASKYAILNANYVARRLGGRIPVLYTGANGRVAHECILDLRPLLKASQLLIDDVAKRLMDYGFHAPTMSFPVAHTFMVEPTESESKAELDRFCEAMERIADEMEAVARGEVEPERSVLRGAPHTALDVAADRWDRAYGRERAAFPAPWTREAKFWPAVGRVDHVWGDRHPCCSWIEAEEIASARPGP